MVAGFKSFREHFGGYEDCYTVIGGTACDILMSEAAQAFRATHNKENSDCLCCRRRCVGVPGHNGR